jgi:hypothetical protein
METKKTKGFVYFIQKKNQDIFKIGMTYSDPEKRLKQLQISTPDELLLVQTIYCNHPRILENQLHIQFKEKHIRGEWFNLSEATIQDFVNSYPDNIHPEWIELKQGYRIFLYNLKEGDLYIDLHSLKLSSLYIASIFSSGQNLVGFYDGTIAIKYDLFIQDWPDLAKDLNAHKSHLLNAVIQYLVTEK